MARKELEDFIAANQITMTTKFVPFSQSRNKGEKSPSLNWAVTIHKANRTVITTDYMAGCGNAPSYKQNDNTVDRAKLVAFECEHGKRGSWFDGHIARKPGGKAIEPELCDVLYSLSMDASVLNSGGFEDWAAELGYDTDSRKAEAIYRQCVDIAMKLRQAFDLEALANAAQDY